MMDTADPAGEVLMQDDYSTVEAWQDAAASRLKENLDQRPLTEAEERWVAEVAAGYRRRSILTCCWWVLVSVLAVLLLWQVWPG